jgi:hypothetical protein
MFNEVATAQRHCLEVDAGTRPSFLVLFPDPDRHEFMRYEIEAIMGLSSGEPEPVSFQPLPDRAPEVGATSSVGGAG